ncbi:unnamed protein product [Arctogadus glacialis]
MDFKPFKRCHGPTRCGAAGVDDNAPPESCDVIVELRDMRMMRMMMSPSYCGEQGTRGTRRLCEEEAMGADNSGVLYALWSYQGQAADELGFNEGDMVTILQKAQGVDWWWASLCGREGFVPNNYFGV